MTFLGAQEIDSDLAIERPLMVSSADFAAFTKAGEAIVNYTIVDLDGDGIGELVVVNSASVAGDDVISDPVPTLQLGDIAVTGQSGTSLRTQQDGISGRPGDLVQIEASGFNPVSSQSNRVVWTANGTVVEATATASGGTPQTLSFQHPGAAGWARHRGAVEPQQRRHPRADRGHDPGGRPAGGALPRRSSTSS